MKKQKRIESTGDIFDRFFYFLADNGYALAMFPSSWDKREERRKINELEEKKQKYRN